MEPLLPEQLQQLAAQYLEQMNEWLVCIDAEGRIVYANPSAQSDLGIENPQSGNLRVLDTPFFLSPDTWARYFDKTLAQGQASQSVYHREDESRHLFIISRPLRIQEQNVLWSKVKEVSETLVYRDMLESIEKAIGVGSWEWRIKEQTLIASGVAKQICGVSSDRELLPGRMAKHFADGYRILWEEALDTLVQEKTPFELELLYERKGKQKWLLTHCLPVLQDDSVVMVRGFFKDISAAKSPAGFRSLEAVQREHILEALKKTNWRVSGPKGAARLLQMNDKTLFARMKKLGIQKPD
jgi:PAS domain-containing protein